MSPWREAGRRSTEGPDCTRQDCRGIHRRCPRRVTQTVLCKQLGQVSEYLACRYRRGLHPPDTLIEPVFSRRESLHNLESAGPSDCGPAFFVRGAPTSLRAPPRRPPRRLARARAPAPRTHSGGSPYDAQWTSARWTYAIRRLPTRQCPRRRSFAPPSFVRTEPLTACARGVWPSPGGPRDPLSSAHLP
jgi:hypothetical protein